MDPSHIIMKLRELNQMLLDKLSNVFHKDLLSLSDNPKKITEMILCQRPKFLNIFLHVWPFKFRDQKSSEYLDTLYARANTLQSYTFIVITNFKERPPS